MESVLLEYGYQKSKIDPCLFHLYKEEEEIHILVYVDDILIIHSQKEIDSIVEFMKKRFKKLTMQTDLKKFLGVKVEIQNKDGYKDIVIHQSEYIEEILSDNSWTKEVNHWRRR